MAPLILGDAAAADAAHRADHAAEANGVQVVVGVPSADVVVEVKWGTILTKRGHRGSVFI